MGIRPVYGKPQGQEAAARKRNLLSTCQVEKRVATLHQPRSAIVRYFFSVNRSSRRRLGWLSIASLVGGILLLGLHFVEQARKAAENRVPTSSAISPTIDHQDTKPAESE